jgi:hypothetical protein
MLALQRGHKHGALAELIPGVERLQEKLRVVDKNLGELKETTEALRKGQGEESARAGKRHTEVLERLKQLERSGIDAAGGGAAATRAVADATCCAPATRRSTAFRPRSCQVWLSGSLRICKSPPQVRRISPER